MRGRVCNLLLLLVLASAVEVTLRPTVSRLVSLGVRRPSGTRDQFYFLLELAVKVKVTLRPTISRPVRLGVRRPSGTRDQFFFLLEIFF
jgi:hypothetical protein